MSTPDQLQFMNSSWYLHGKINAAIPKLCETPNNATYHNSTLAYRGSLFQTLQHQRSHKPASSSATMRCLWQGASKGDTRWHSKIGNDNGWPAPAPLVSNECLLRTAALKKVCVGKKAVKRGHSGTRKQSLIKWQSSWVDRGCPHTLSLPQTWTEKKASKEKQSIGLNVSIAIIMIQIYSCLPNPSDQSLLCHIS